jgi:hypothetical protein
LGIKTNVEMLYLVDEMYKQNGRTISLNFGKIISYTKFNESKTNEEWSKEIKEHVYKIKTDKNVVFE